MVSPCREIHSLLPLFFDSELDPRQMRVVALHTAKCPSCESEIRELERGQEAIADTIHQMVDEIDLSTIWPSIEDRLAPVQPTWLERFRLWWEQEQPLRWAFSGPALGAAVAGFALAFVLLWSSQPAPTVVATPNTMNETAVSVDTINASSNVALLSEADTLLLWVDDELTDGPTDADTTGLDDLQ